MKTSRQLVTQLLEAENEWTFRGEYKAEVNDYDEGDDFKEAECKLSIVWEADFDVRSWGIKEIMPVIKAVTGVVEILHPDTGDPVDRIPVSYPEPSTPEHLQQVIGDAPTPESSPKEWASYYGPSKDPWDVEIEHSPNHLEPSLALCISSVRISVRTRTITIEF